MSAFRVGEVAIIQNAVHRPHLNGAEVTVLAANFTGTDPDGSKFIGYQLDIRNDRGVLLVARPHQLRKRRPPYTDESESRQAMLDCIERARRGVVIEEGA